MTRLFGSPDVQISEPPSERVQQAYAEVERADALHKGQSAYQKLQNGLWNIGEPTENEIERMQELRAKMQTPAGKIEPESGMDEAGRYLGWYVVGVLAAGAFLFVVTH